MHHNEFFEKVHKREHVTADDFADAVESLLDDMDTFIDQLDRKRTTNMEDTYTINGSSNPKSPLRAHEYIVIKRTMTAADEAWIQNRASRVSGDKKKPEIQLTIGDVDLALLKRMIVRWNLTKEGSDGKQHPIDLSDKAIEELPRRIAKFVKAVINDLNPEEDEEFDDFLPSAVASSATN